MKTGTYQHKQNCVRPGGLLADCQNVENRSALMCRILQEPPTNHKLRNLVNLYKSNWRCCFCKRLTGFANLSFERAINYAAAGKEFDGQTHNCHLRRLKNKSLAAGWTALSSKAKQLKSCKTFDNLYTEVENTVTEQRISGLGLMYFYDVALRIGASQGILPNNVYLPCGAKHGAQNLSKVLHLELDFDKRSIDMNRLPDELKCLTEYEVEDFLCIFGNSFSCDGKKTNGKCQFQSL